VLCRADKRRPSFQWRVRLGPGKYQLEVFTRFHMPDGRYGDTVAGLGLYVDSEDPLRIIAAPKRPTN